MKIRRFFTVLIVCVSCITFLSVPVSAADGTENIDVANMTLKGEIWYKDQEEPDDVTSSTTIQSSGDYYRINLPISDTNKSRLLVGITLTELFDFNTEHEYSLKFQWKSNIDKGMHCYISLVYYDNQGTELKVQDLVNEYDSSSSGGYNSVDISFKPDTSGLSGGYNCDLRIYFMQNGWDGTSTTQAVFISKEIELIDKDGSSDYWLPKIYSAIMLHDANIDAAVSQLETKLINQLISFDSNVDSYIDTLDNHIKVYLQSLGNNLLAAISSLDSNLAGYIKSFQDTLIANDNSIFEALKEFLHNEMNPGVYDDPGSDDFQDNKDDWEQIEGELPTFDSSDMHEVDISNYSGGFGAVRYLFDRFLNASGLTTLMSFSLMFGLGVFLIGRKVGG